MLDDLAHLNSDGKQIVGGIEGVVGIAIDQAGFADAGLAEQQQLDGDEHALLGGKRAHGHDYKLGL